MSDQIFWYISRSSGLVAWLAAAGSILVGVMTPSRLLGRRPTIPWLIDLHRMLAALATVFLIAHMASLWFDEFVRFRLHDLLIPWVAEVPGLGRTSLAVGVIAAWLTAAVEATSLIRDHMSVQVWRTIHLSSYAILALGTWHAIAAGSDIENPVVAAIGISVLTAVVLATLVRVRRGRLAQRPSRSGRGGEPDAARSSGARRPALGGPATGVDPRPMADAADRRFRTDPGWGPPSSGGTMPRDARRSS